MLWNIAPKAEGRTVIRARRLRRDMTLPEVLLWRELRKRPGGLKFRRQHGSGDYVLDFFCSDARLRVPAAAVLDDLSAVIVGIVEEARNRLPLHHPPFDKLRTGGPPPRASSGRIELAGACRTPPSAGKPHSLS